MLRQLESGASLAEVFERVNVGEIRSRVSESLERFERLRHAVKVTTFALAREESLSIGHVSRQWQISRQRGQQYAHEAAQLHRSGPTS